MKQRTRHIITGLLSGTIILMLFIRPTAAQDPYTTGTQGQTTYTATLSPENNSGVSGTAYFTLEGNVLHVRLMINGVEAGQIHPQHIHGFTDKRNSVCAPPSADMNGNGYVELPEAQPYAGPVFQPFEPYPTPDTASYVFEASYTVNPDELNPLENRVVEVHGLSIDGEYRQDVPAACGEIVAGPSGMGGMYQPDDRYQHRQQMIQQRIQRLEERMLRLQERSLNRQQYLQQYQTSTPPSGCHSQ